MKHIFIYRLKCMLKDKILLFWTFVFPIALATFFFLAFSNLTKSEKLDPIALGIVTSSQYEQQESLKKTVEELDQANVIEVSYPTLEEAKTLLEEGKLAGYLTYQDTLMLEVTSSNINTTVLKSIFDTVLATQSSLTTILQENPELANTDFLKNLTVDGDHIVNETNQNTDTTVIYFYTLIGMVCMYAGFWGLKTINEMQADQSPQGARFAVSPTSKWKSFFSAILIAFLVQLVEIFLLLGFLMGILNVSFGANLGFIFLLCILGCLVGILFGCLVGVAFKISTNTKITIISMGSLLLSFLSGMMVVNIKYIIHENVPLLAKINPVSLVTDALYSLYYYSTLDRFWNSIYWLLGIALFLTLATFYYMRRKRYESI